MQDILVDLALFFITETVALLGDLISQVRAILS